MIYAVSLVGCGIVSPQNRCVRNSIRRSLGQRPRSAERFAGSSRSWADAAHRV